jgi:hypothetical protein
MWKETRKKLTKFQINYVLKNHGANKMIKQTIFDWYRQNKKELKKSHASAFINCNKGTITLKYPDGFTWELRAEDFPMRNGEYGQDAIPGPSHKRILVGGSLNGGLKIQATR